MEHHVPVTAQAVPAGKRRTSRLRVKLPAKLITLKCTVNATLLDLSYFGARMSAAEPPCIGAEVVVEWGPYEGFGKVIWTNQYMFGVGFYDPIEPNVLIATRDLDDREHMPSEAEQRRRAARAWVQGSS